MWRSCALTWRRREPDADSAPLGRRDRHGRLHVAGTGAGQAARSAHRHLLVRLCALRGHHRHGARFRGRHPSRRSSAFWRRSPSRSSSRCRTCDLQPMIRRVSGQEPRRSVSVDAGALARSARPAPSARSGDASRDRRPRAVASPAGGRGRDRGAGARRVVGDGERFRLDARQRRVGIERLDAERHGHRRREARAMADTSRGSNRWAACRGFACVSSARIAASSSFRRRRSDTGGSRSRPMPRACSMRPRARRSRPDVCTSSACWAERRARSLTGIDSTITLSPDGRQFAFYRASFPERGSSALIVADVDGGTPRVLATTRGQQFFVPAFFAAPSWSPDGVTHCRSDSRCEDGRRRTRHRGCRRRERSIRFRSDSRTRRSPPGCLMDREFCSSPIRWTR